MDAALWHGQVYARAYTLRMWRGISLANKCLLLFGGAVVLIVVAALAAPWIRMNSLVDEGQLELSRQLVHVWEQLQAEEGGPAATGEPVEHAGVVARRMTLDAANALGEQDKFIRKALRVFREQPARNDIQQAHWRRANRVYRYARAIRSEDDSRLVGLILLERSPMAAARLLAVNTLYLLSAGAWVLLLAVLVFYLITNRIILSPVRELKTTAELVREGDLSTRAKINTGDEFEELSETFNAMLSNLQTNHDQLRAINAAMDLKLNELAETNVSLHESAKLKGEFLANVSHELRTPLNSIIGFAELLLEIARVEADAGDDSTRLAKRIRYLENIVTAGRHQLEMINSLLEMAKIEAGRLEITPEKMSLHETCEGLIGLIQPLASRKGITVKLDVEPGVPIIETDVTKVQQIIFNFLSNAVKFTPPSPQASGSSGGAVGAGTDGGGEITVRVERLVAGGGGVVGGGGGVDETDRVRISVLDTGPGIAAEDQQRIFEKFEQLEAGHTRPHAGTGLGLAISRELAATLQGEVQLVSDVGRGSMFSLILPLELDRDILAESTLEARFRGTLAGRRRSL